ncbi:MAG: hypothetical protein WCI77_07170 [Candidatus Omnitrophota bacterium]
MIVREGKLVSTVNRIVFAYYKIYGKFIFSSKSILCDKNSGCEVHLLTCARDVLLALWCLKSFYYHSGLSMRLVIHDDGTLDDSLVEKFQKHFINCEVIKREDADIEMKQYLKGYEFCERYRYKDFFAHAIKLFDAVYYSRTKEILLLDSDVLFFKKPIEMIESIREKKGFFMNDYREAYCLPAARLQILFNMAIRSRINSGILYLPDKKIYDLNLIESFLKIVYENWEEINRIPEVFWVEQTAWAIFLSKHRGMFTRLPDSYQVSRQPITDTTVSQHFVWDGSRDNFYKEGLREIKKADFLRKFNKQFKRN